jgi:large subunit ribosomal protein L21
MYAIVEINGHQYRVSAGDIIDVEKLSNEESETMSFENVIFVGGENTIVGAPTVAGAKLTAKVIRQARSRKIVVLKRKPGKYVKKNGHRQHYTSLLITEIDNGNGNVAKIDSANNNAKKYL